MPKNIQTTTQLHSSHKLTKWCSNFSKPGFNSTWTVNIQIFKQDLKKAEEPEIKLSMSAGSLENEESSRKTSISALWTTPKPLMEKAMASHSSTLAWKIPWMKEPGRLHSMGSLRVGHDWVTSLSLFTFIHWRRKRQPTPVFLPGESQGRGSLVGCRLWGHTESDTTEVIQQQQAFDCVDHNKLWKILKKMGIPDDLTCLLRNLYAG